MKLPIRFDIRSADPLVRATSALWIAIGITLLMSVLALALIAFALRSEGSWGRMAVLIQGFLSFGMVALLGWLTFETGRGKRWARIVAAVAFPVSLLIWLPLSLLAAIPAGYGLWQLFRGEGADAAADSSNTSHPVDTASTGASTCAATREARERLGVISTARASTSRAARSAGSGESTASEGSRLGLPAWYQELTCPAVCSSVSRARTSKGDRFFSDVPPAGRRVQCLPRWPDVSGTRGRTCRTWCL